LRRFLLIFFILVTLLPTAPALAADVAGTDPIVRLYPNPATSFINLDLSKAANRGYSIQIYSFLGRKMYEAMNVSERVSLNLTDYNRGVYVYKLRDREGKLIETGKFQVTK
jgi:hypothetical protein